MDSFEAWTRQEIARLRAEADSLDGALSRYLNLRRSPVVIEPASLVTERRHQRRSKNDPILDAVNRAGAHGISLDEAERAARQAGIEGTRAAIRTFLWNEKRRGRLRQVENGNFVSTASQTNEAADPASGGEPAASSSSTPNDADRRGEVVHDNMNH